MKKVSVIVCLVFLFPICVLGIEPNEVLENPLLEQRAREISQNIRCMVCQNENIDDSAAELARDFRILIREKLVEGYSDQQIYDYIVERYGEFALLKPRFDLQNWMLYFSGPILVLIGLLVVLRRFKLKKNENSDVKILTPEEERVVEMLRKENRN